MKAIKKIDDAFITVNVVVSETDVYGDKLKFKAYSGYVDDVVPLTGITFTRECNFDRENPPSKRFSIIVKNDRDCFNIGYNAKGYRRLYIRTIERID